MKTIKELDMNNHQYEERMVYYYMALKDVLELINETWKDRKQTTDKILFMCKFKEELKARIKGK